MSTPSPVSAKPPQPPRLLELVRQVARTRFGQEARKGAKKGGQKRGQELFSLIPSEKVPGTFSGPA